MEESLDYLLPLAYRKWALKPPFFEAAPSFKPLGAGLTLAVNAMKALDYLDLKKQVCQAGRHIDALHVLNKRGVALSNVAPALNNKSFQNHAIHRGDLHEVLLAQLPEKRIQWGKKLKNIAYQNKGVDLHFEDGTTHSTQYLISAEGIHSKVRKTLLPKSKERYAGYTCWRGIAENTFSNPIATSETWGVNGRFGIVPLAKKRIYWFAVMKAMEKDENLSKWGLEQIKEQFTAYHPAVHQVLNANQSGPILWNDIVDLKPIDQYAFGNILLMGDAAHATTPNMGQGACMALEDAATLTYCMQQLKDPKEAFKRFEERRMKRTHWVVNQSWQLGKIAQNQNPFFGSMRNTLMRMVPNSVSKKQLETIYRFSVEGMN